jgi:hypothetical protein
MRDNRFYNRKALGVIARNIRNATAIWKGTLLVEVFNEKQAEACFKAILLGCDFLHFERHTSFNSSQVVLTTDFPRSMSGENIQL